MKMPKGMKMGKTELAEKKAGVKENYSLAGKAEKKKGKKK